MTEEVFAYVPKNKRDPDIARVNEGELKHEPKKDGRQKNELPAMETEGKEKKEHPKKERKRKRKEVGAGSSDDDTPPRDTFGDATLMFGQGYRGGVDTEVQDQSRIDYAELMKKRFDD